MGERRADAIQAEPNSRSNLASRLRSTRLQEDSREKVWQKSTDYRSVSSDCTEPLYVECYHVCSVLDEAKVRTFDSLARGCVRTVSESVQTI